MKKKLILAIFAILMLAAVSSVPAQEEQEQEQQGESKVVSRGTATNSQGVKFFDWEMMLVKNKPLKITRPINTPEAHSYYFKARKGQNISAKLDSKNTTVSFEIYDAEGNKLGDSTTGDRSWQGNLENDGEYKIVTSADEKSNYTLTVKLN